ncbi:hypothetical protein Tco_1517050 [Tanacetum coccineum]
MPNNHSSPRKLRRRVSLTPTPPHHLSHHTHHHFLIYPLHHYLYHHPLALHMLMDLWDPELLGLGREMHYRNDHLMIMNLRCLLCLPLRKRLCRTTPGPGYEVGESSAAGTARRVGPTTARTDRYGFADTLEAAPGRRMSRELGYGIRDTWDDLRDEIIYSQLDDERMTELYLDPERQLVETLKIVKSLKAQMTELQRQQGPAKDPAEPEHQERPVAVLRLDYDCSYYTKMASKRKAHKNHEAMIDEGVTAILAARAMTRNGYNSNGSGPRPAQTARECSYSEFLKCKPWTSKP